MKPTNTSTGTNDSKTWNVTVLPPINITSWGNNYTNDETLNFSVQAVPNITSIKPKKIKISTKNSLHI